MREHIIPGNLFTVSVSNRLTKHPTSQRENKSPLLTEVKKPRHSNMDLLKSVILAAALLPGATLAGNILECTPGQDGNADGAQPLSIGTLDPQNGYPLVITDTNNVAVELCLDSSDGQGTPPNCIFDPQEVDNLFSQQIGFGLEAFWWSADTSINGPDPDFSALLVLAVEAAFFPEEIADGNQFPFTRLRVRINVPQAGTYTMTHPYGVNRYEVAAADIGPRPEIRETFDIEFNANTIHQGRIGPLLVADNSPVGFLGDGVSETTVTGSPCHTNFLRIEGIDGLGNPIDLNGLAPGTAAESNLFTVTGKIATRVPTPLTIQRTSYEREIDGTGQVSAFATSDPAPNTEVEIQDVPGGVAALTGDATGTFFVRAIATPDANSLPNVVRVTAENAIEDKDPTTIHSLLVDEVIISRADYVPTTQTLTIEATSSDRGTPPVLTAEKLGTLNNGSLTKLNVSVPPASVIVTSSARGRDIEPITVLLDTDGDGIPDRDDNCTLKPNGSILPSGKESISQRDTDGDGFGNVCDTDLDNSGVTNLLDVGKIRALFLCIPSADPASNFCDHADFNGDNVVNLLDVGILKQTFLKVPGPAGILP